MTVAPIVDGAEQLRGQADTSGSRTESARRLARWQRGVPRVASDHQPLVAAVARQRPTTWAPSGCSTPSSRSGRWSPRARPGTWACSAATPCSPPGWPDRRPRAGAGHAGDAGPVPGPRGRRADRGGAGPHPPPPALRLGRVRHRQPRRHLRLRRRHAAVRHAAGRAAPLGPGARGGGPPDAPRRPGAGVDRPRSATGTATATSSTSGPPTGASATRAGRTPSRHPPRPTAARPRRPLALAEVQGYVYARLRGPRPLRHRGRRRGGGRALAGPGAGPQGRVQPRLLGRRAAGWFAAGARRRQAAARRRSASNMGHCLWTGIVDEDKAAVAGQAAAVRRPVRGLGRAHAGHVHGRLRPAQLPHGVGVAARQRGLRRRPDALRVRGGGPPAGRWPSSTRPRPAVAGPPCCAASTGRTCGPRCASPTTARRGRPRPRPRCGTCARSCASTRGSPRASCGSSPVLPEAIGRLRVERIPLHGGHGDRDVDGDRVEVEDLPPGVEMIAEPRRPLARGA